MISSGTLAATVPSDMVEETIDSLNTIGVLSADVGHVTNKIGVSILRKGKPPFIIVKFVARKMNWPACGSFIPDNE